MARFNLNKGERFSLKKSEGLSKIKVVIGWKNNADLDACAFLTGKDGIIEDDADFVFYNSENRREAFNKDKFGNKKKWREMVPPVSADGSVVGSLDDKGGEEDSSDEANEEMYVHLDQVGANISEIIFCVTIYHGDEQGVTFGKVVDPYISIINEESGDELCRYDLKEKFSDETAVVAGSLVCDAEGEWSFEAKGKGYTGGMQTLIDLYA